VCVCACERGGMRESERVLDRGRERERVSHVCRREYVVREVIGMK
jgi:hypothetical protein